MKKLLSVVLSIALLCGCNLTAFAETTTSAGEQSTDVYAEFVAGTKSSTIFTVDIEWTAMEFIYHEGNEPVWNPETHTYSESSDAYWDGSGTITITNHTNAPITAQSSYTALDDYSDAKVAFSSDKFLLDSAEINNEAKEGTITVVPYGSLSELNEKTKIGAVTINLTSLDIANEDISTSKATAKKTELETAIADTKNYATPVNNLTEIETGRYYLNSDMSNATLALEELSNAITNFTAGSATQKELNYAYAKANFYTVGNLWKTK